MGEGGQLSVCQIGDWEARPERTRRRDGTAEGGIGLSDGLGNGAQERCGSEQEEKSHGEKGNWILAGYQSPLAGCKSCGAMAGRFVGRGRMHFRE